MNEMNSSEELVSKLCTKSFLSMWSYPMPQGKNPGKELCDLLVVCDPDIIIFSVKEIALKDSGNPSVDWERWRKRAIEDSCKQIYGAERWMHSATNVTTRDGENALPFPDISRRQMHRVAVALGSQGKVPFSFGDFGKGFVHVFDEVSLNVVMNELDTISDFVKYLSDKESLYERGVMTLFSSGGEEDLLAFYLHQGREFPEGPDFYIIEENLWSTFIKKPEYRAKKEADRISYAWDRLTETLCEDYRTEGLIADYPYSPTTLTEVEKVIRVMARENRFCRRLLGEKFVEFLELSRAKKIKSRIVPSLSDVLYVFLGSPRGEERKYRVAELAARCFIARGLSPNARIVIGIGTEQPEYGKGFSLDAYYLNKEDWTAEDQKQLEYLKKELGFFANPIQSRLKADEYPMPS